MEFGFLVGDGCQQTPIPAKPFGVLLETGVVQGNLMGAEQEGRSLSRPFTPLDGQACAYRVFAGRFGIGFWKSLSANEFPSTCEQTQTQACRQQEASTFY
jgi:hypothetical protein